MCKIVSALLVSSLCLGISSHAAEPVAAKASPGSPVALGIRGGTLGGGLEGTLRLSPNLNLRVSGNKLTGDYDDDDGDIAYDVDLDLQTFLVMLDWHVFKNAFRLTGGVSFNNNGITIEGRTTESETIGNHVYTPAEIGTIRGELDFDGTTGYLGIGVGNAVKPGSSFTFTADLGVIIQDYEVDLSADGLLGADPGFQADLREEEEEVQDDLDEFSVYPVVSVGVAYHF